MGEEKRSWFDYCTAVTEVRQKYTHETMSESVTECKCRSLQLITQRMSKSRKLTTHNPEVTPSCVTQCHLWIGKWVKKRFSLLAHSSSSFILALEKHSCINWHIHTHTQRCTVCVHLLIPALHTCKKKQIHILAHTHTANTRANRYTPCHWFCVDAEYWDETISSPFQSLIPPQYPTTDCMHCVCTGWTDALKEQKRWTSWDFCRIISSQ